MFSAGAARCSPAEGQGRNGVPADGNRRHRRGGLIATRWQHVLLFSAKALLSPQPLGGGIGQRYGWKRYRPMPTRPGKRRFAGLTLKYPPPNLL